MRIALTLALLLSLGCAGALWSDSEGKALMPLAFGNSEFSNDSTCVSGGPISEGLVGLVGDVVQMGLSIFQGGTVGQDGEPSQDTPRQAGCFVAAPKPELED